MLFMIIVEAIMIIIIDVLIPPIHCAHLDNPNAHPDRPFF